MGRSEGYDAVVVGGGAAGCVVAARLAESGSRSVLLLEAGPDRRRETPDALRDGWQIAPPEFNWGYESEPNPRGNVQNVWRTRLLGGTSWLTRFAPRGAPADYDEWEALGNHGWGFDDVLPYFTRLEADLEFGHEPWHGDSGPVPVTRYLDLEFTDVAAAALRALDATGFPPVDDHNRPGAVGAGRMPMSSTAGRRVTTADAYLPAGRTAPNLTIRPDTLVAEVLFDGPRAGGVRLGDGTELEAGHVILCAGVYGNPPILMRSGVGPAGHLRAMEIPVRADLPGVGANLADHPAVAIDCGRCGESRTEPLLHFIATFHSSTNPTDAPPDLMIWGSDPEEETFELVVVLLKPRSRGAVRLHSAAPDAAPRIELPALSDPFDVDRLAEGYRRALEVANHADVREHCGAAALADPSRDELLELIRNEAWSLPHVVGTCSMGVRPDAGAVVDPGGLVHGTEALSVIDASIMPTVPSGFTHVPTIMLGERLSDGMLSAR